MRIRALENRASTAPDVSKVLARTSERNCGRKASELDMREVSAARCARSQDPQIARSQKLGLARPRYGAGQGHGAAPAQLLRDIDERCGLCRDHESATGR